jgi:membrane-bound serine protease (ClpP class)
VLAIYGLGFLTVNWVGIIFLVIAFILFILDIKAPTHGALTAAGVGSMIVGALVLFNSPATPSFQRVSVPLVVGTTLFTAAIFFTALTFGVRAQRIPVLTGTDRMVGREGIVRSSISPRGNVQLGGELWGAELVEGEEPLPPGTRVQVVEVKGLRLRVRKV